MSTTPDTGDYLARVEGYLSRRAISSVDTIDVLGDRNAWLEYLLASDLRRLVSDYGAMSVFIEHVASLPIADGPHQEVDVCGCPIHQAQHFVAGLKGRPSDG